MLEEFAVHVCSLATASLPQLDDLVVPVLVDRYIKLHGVGHPVSMDDTCGSVNKCHNV